MNITKTINTWLEERSTAKQLRQLSDRGLSDIGVERGNIDRAVKRAVRNGTFYL